MTLLRRLLAMLAHNTTPRRHQCCSDEQMARITLYSTSRRQVRATPKDRP